MTRRGEQIQDPVPEVVRQKLATTYEFNTAIVTKTGKQRKISIIMQPLVEENPRKVSQYP
jgi:hypothetical protein